MSLGTEYDPTGTHRDAPFAHFRRMRNEEPVSWCEWLGASMVSRYATVKQVLNTPGVFSSHGATPMHVELQPEPIQQVLADADLPGTPILETDGDTHRAHRTLWSAYFDRRRIARMQDGMARQARQVLSGLPDAATVDLVSEFARPYVLGVIGGEFMGLPPEQHERAWQQAMDVVTWATPWLPMDERLDAARRTREAKHYYRGRYAQLGSQPLDGSPPSIAAHLQNYEQFLVVDQLLWTAAVDTTWNALLNAIWGALSRDLWHELDDPALRRAVIEESIRYDTPHRGLMRTVLEDTELDGVSLPAGARVLLLFGSANRDERQFPHPDVFDPRRPNLTSHVGFGHGPHACIGATLAREEIDTALRELRTVFPKLRLADQAVEYTPNLFYRGPMALPVHLARTPETV